ncbi:hypothetical protein AB0N31_28740 [Streptomyces sp. NPDC051051]|uniref:hypothetical protein n=1 Tax=Streptomyces sp. NPDC051051 TaxID=3155666 RepID=UPI003448C65A
MRDTTAWARQRAAANTAAFPDPGAGRPVPGMYLGSLAPVPEAQPDVGLLTALIRHEALEAAVNRGQLPAMAWGSAALFPLRAPLTGKYAVLPPLAVLTPPGLLGTLRVNASRRAKPVRQLVAAGCTAVPDGSGRGATCGRHRTPSDPPGATRDPRNTGQKMSGIGTTLAV